MRVDVWSDIICPWCYLGREHLLTALSEYDGDVQVVYHSFELDPTSPQGTTEPTVKRLAVKYGMSEAEAIAAQRQMEQRAATAGLEFHLDGQRSGNTRAAHRLLHLARQRDRQDTMIERLYRAHFTESRSIFEQDSLVNLAVEAGLDPDEAAVILEGSEFDDLVEADERMAHELGVTGVPFFVVDRRFAFSGAQPAGVITDVLARASAA